jgi:hypothetical protein
MSENENLVHVGAALNIEQLNQRIEDLQELLRKVFRKGIDYGYLPGMEEKKEREDAAFAEGKRKEKSAVKPMLLKPGVEKIDTRYGLFPFYIEQPTRELPGDHREVKLICELRTPGGVAIAQGVGSCSTYESKYRYRWTSTDRRVPKEYWDSRDPDILGGKQYSPRKNYDEETGKSEWFIFEKIGVADPADVWNTIYKMAAKRAKSDATFSATAAGDIFDTEDLEDPDLIPVGEQKQEKKNGAKANPPATPTTKQPATESKMPKPKPGEDHPPDESGEGADNPDESYRDKLFKAVNGDVNELKRLTSFYSKRDKKDIPGKGKWEWVSEAGAKTAYHRLQDELKDKGLPFDNGDQREPGQEG